MNREEGPVFVSGYLFISTQAQFEPFFPPLGQFEKTVEKQAFKGELYVYYIYFQGLLCWVCTILTWRLISFQKKVQAQSGLK